MRDGADDELDHIEELADSLWVTDPQEAWPIIEELMNSLRQFLATQSPLEWLPFGYTHFLMFISEFLDPPSKAAYFRARTPEQRTILCGFLQELVDTGEEALVDWVDLGSGIERQSDNWWPGTVNEKGLLNLDGLAESMLVRIGVSKQGALSLTFRKAGWDGRRLLRAGSESKPAVWSAGVTLPMHVARVTQMLLPLQGLLEGKALGRYQGFVATRAFKWATVIESSSSGPLIVLAEGDPLWGACTSTEPTDAGTREEHG